MALPGNFPPPAPSGIWHVVATAGEPGFQGAWQNFGAPFHPTSFRLDSGLVRLRGIVSTGTVNLDPIFTLPVGYRPTNQMVFVSVTDSGPARIDVMPDGTVRPISGGNIFVSLNAISYYVL